MDTNVCVENQNEGLKMKGIPNERHTKELLEVVVKMAMERGL